MTKSVHYWIIDLLIALAAAIWLDWAEAPLWACGLGFSLIYLMGRADSQIRLHHLAMRDWAGRQA